MSSANDPDDIIELHVGLASSYPTWTPCPSPNQSYAYDFVGGDYDSNHGFKFDHISNPGNKWVRFQLHGIDDSPVNPATTFSKFNITDVDITQDPQSPPIADQLQKLSGANSTDKLQVIKDKNDVAATGEITVTVTDISVSPPVTGIVCDPKWANN